MVPCYWEAVEPGFEPAGVRLGESKLKDKMERK